MTRGARFAIRFAVLGMAITAVFLAYILLAGPANRSETLDWVLSVLCPPSVLSLLFFDLFLDKTATAFVGWLIIGLLNSGLYALVGVVVSRYFWKSGQLTTNLTAPPH
jgi:hypothetical protein